MIWNLEGVRKRPIIFRVKKMLKEAAQLREGHSQT